MHFISDRFLRRRQAATARRRRAVRSAQLERFEDRRLLATFDLVPGAADGAAGSLRDALQQANFNSEHDTINLAAGTYSITLSGIEDEDNLRGDFDVLESGRTVTVRGQGIGVTTIDGGRLDRVFDVFATVTLVLEDLTITRGRLTGTNEDADGGGVRNAGNLHLTNVEIVGNEGHAGGGILNDGSASLTDSIVSNNSSSVHGGGIKTYGPLTVTDSRITNNMGSIRGGGIEVDGAGGVNIVGTTISGNSVGGGTGGGINNYGGSLTISSSTVSGNTAGLAGGYAEEGGASTHVNVTYSGNSAVLHGGGFYNNGGEMTMLNSTISGNTADMGGGGYNYGGLVRPRNTLIAGNTAATESPDYRGSIKGLGFNLIGNSGGTRFHRDDAGNNLLDVNPMLGPLADNGGSTLTHALMDGSPAIDAGTITEAPTTDQRGTLRPQGSSVDVGAFEVEAIADTEPPTVEIVDIAPDPRNFPVTLVTVTFSEDVVGVDVNDFALSRDGQPIDLVSAGATLVQNALDLYTLNLSSAGVADIDGQYELSLVSTGSGIFDLAGNPLSTGDGDTWFFDGTRPTADIVDVLPDPRDTPAGNVAINFSEDVTGVDLSDFTLTRNGANVNLASMGVTLTALSASSYSLNLGVAGVTDRDGSYTLRLRAVGSGIQDALGNALNADAVDTWAFDAAPPTADIVDVSPDPRVTPVPAVIITFSEGVTGVNISDFTLTRNGQVVNMLGLGATLGQLNPALYTISMGAPGISDLDGSYVLTLNAAGSGIQDLFGRALATDASDSWIFDRGGPEAAILDVEPDPRNEPVESVFVEFNEPVTGVSIDDFRLTFNGGDVDLVTGGASVTAESTSRYRLNLAPVTTGDGTYVLTLEAAGSGILDAGNFELLDDATTSWFQDSSAPTADILDVTPDPRNQPAQSVTISFSEPVTGVDLSDFTLTRNGNAVALSPTAVLIADSPSQYRLNLGSLAGADGQYVLTLNAAGSGILDAGGNPLGGGAADSWTMDATRPTGDILDVAPDPRTSSVSEVVVEFSEVVVDLQVADFTLTVNGVGVNLAQQGASLSQLAPTRYQLNLAGAGGEGIHTLVLNGNGVHDATGNPLIGNPSDSWTVDSIAPTADIVDVAPDPANVPVASITVNFSESVTGLDIADFTLTRNGSPLDLIGLGATLSPASGATYQLNLSAAGITDTDGDYLLSLVAAGSGIRDVAGNSLPAGATDSWRLDATPPSATIEEATPDPRTAPVDSLTIGFDEAVVDLSLADFTLTVDSVVVDLAQQGAVLSQAGATEYSLDLTSIGSGDGQYVLRLNATGVHDSVGNELVEDVVESWTLDATPPTVNLSEVAPDPRAAAVAGVDARFSESVTGVDLADFRLTRNGVQVNLAAAGVQLQQLAPDLYRLNLSAGAVANSDGVYVLSIEAPGSGIVDGVGNSLAGGATESWTIDLTPPRVDIIEVTPDPRNEPVSAVSIVFTEHVTGFDLGDLSLTRNGSAVDLVGLGAGLSQVGPGRYALDLSAAGLSDADGQYVLTLLNPGSGIRDVVGNGLQGNDSDSWTTDATPPTATFEPVAPDPRSEPVPFVDVTFSEPVTGLDVDDFRLLRDGSPVALSAAGVVLTQLAPDRFRLDLDAGDVARLEGSYELSIDAPGGGITDAVGNPLVAPSVEQWTIDSLSPTADIVDVTPDPRTTPLTTISVNFSEDVTGVDLSDFTLTHDGAPLNIASAGVSLTAISPSHYMLDFAGTEVARADGLYELTLNAAGSGIVDDAGLPLTADASDQWTFDATAPAVVVSSFEPDPKVAPPTSVTFEFSEQVVNVDLTDFALLFGGDEIDLAAGGAVLQSIGATTYELDLSALNLVDIDGSYVLRLVAEGSGIQDLAGNELVAGAQEVWAFGDDFPTLTVSPVFPDPRNTPVATIVFRASEELVNLDPGDFTLTHDGDPIDLQALGVTIVQSGPTEYSLIFPLGSLPLDGDYVLTLIGADADITNLAGNPLIHDIVETWAQDSVIPTVEIVGVVPDPHPIPLNSVMIQFSEEVQGLTLLDFALTFNGNFVNLLSSGAALRPLGDGLYALDLSATGLADTPGHYELTLDTFDSFITDLAENPLEPVTLVEQWDLEFIQGIPPQVVSVGLNTGETDPPDLPASAQPTNWRTQRSEIRTITVVFSDAMDIDVSDIVLTNLGINADVDPDVPVALTSGHVSVVQNELTLSFADGELGEGVYELRILPSATSIGGLPIDGDGDGTGGDVFVHAGNEENGFHRLIADWNGDAGVSIFDFTVFAYWFGTHISAAPEYVNLNGDEGISLFDFSFLAVNFGRFVTYPTPLAEATIPLTTRALSGTRGESPVEEPVSPEQQVDDADDAVPVDDVPIRRPAAPPKDDSADQEAWRPSLEETLDDIVAEIALAWDAK